MNNLISLFRKANEKMSIPVLVLSSVLCVAIFVLFVTFVAFTIKTVMLYAPYMRME